ncbi:DUF726-domain-containing protein [Xylariaceae sp. FL0662B]|nr:DUF726-domain-containing protein [Xylariaceae sp. FL0662B]
MAPLTNEPDAIRVVLNPARRKAFYGLVCEITAYMRSQLELHHSPAVSRPPSSAPPPYSETDDAPLFAPHSTQSRQQRSNNHADADSPSPPPKPPRPKNVPPSPALVRLRRAALSHFDAWRAETLDKLKEVASKADDAKVLEARRKRAEQLAARRRDEPADGEDLLSFDGDVKAAPPDLKPGPNPDMQVGPNDLSNFQTLYHPIPTRLATILAPEDRRELLSATLILLLSTGGYPAYSRALVCYLASALGLPPAFLNGEETEIATTMVEVAQKADAEKQRGGDGMSAEAEARKRREQGQVGRFWKVGLASVAGAAIIGVTGGLAAPAVAGVIGGLMGSVGLGGLASFLGIFWMNGALVGTLFGAFGAKMTGGIVDQYAKEVDDFKFLPLKKEWGEGWSKDGPEARRLRVTIGINGWLTDEEDVTKPWRALGDESEVFALRYEMKTLMALGSKLKGLVASAAWSAVRAEILQRTVLATLQGALWPIFLLSSASNIDNPFSLARNRSEKAGKILADALINKVQGERPVTLVGYSLGARVIYSCLRVLAERKAFGIVDTVVLIGAPVPSNTGHWQMMRTMVSGKVFNVYSENDYILAFLYRTTSMQLGIAGLQAISDEVDGVENLDLSAEVTGHLRYPDLIARILTRCGFPNVKGGEHEIEKDDGEIILQNKGWGETGTLVDVDDPDKRVGPSRHGVRELENEKFDPRTKNVQEQKGEPAVKDARLVEYKRVEERKMNAAPIATGPTDMISTPALRAAAPTTTSMPNLSETSRTSETRTGGTSKSISTTQVEAPTDAWRDTDVRGGGDSGSVDDFDYDSDADEYGGTIKMMDNDSDAELTIVEPLSIEDEENCSSIRAEYPLSR